jgi:hypothetical protein
MLNEDGDDALDETNSKQGPIKERNRKPIFFAFFSGFGARFIAADLCPLSGLASLGLMPLIGIGIGELRASLASCVVVRRFAGVKYYVVRSMSRITS